MIASVSICSNTCTVGLIVFLVLCLCCLDDSLTTSLFVVDMMNPCNVVSTVTYLCGNCHSMAIHTTMLSCMIYYMSQLVGCRSDTIFYSVHINKIMLCSCMSMVTSHTILCHITVRSRCNICTYSGTWVYYKML